MHTLICKLSPRAFNQPPPTSRPSSTGGPSCVPFTSLGLPDPLATAGCQPLRCISFYAHFDRASTRLAQSAFDWARRVCPLLCHVPASAEACLTRSHSEGLAPLDCQPHRASCSMHIVISKQLKGAPCRQQIENGIFGCIAHWTSCLGGEQLAKAQSCRCSAAT